MSRPHAKPDLSFVPERGTEKEFCKALGQFPTGVTIVTCMSEIGPLGITANSFTGISIDPPLIMWCPTKASRRHKAFMSAAHFAVHVMSVESEHLCLSFSRSGQAFGEVTWHTSNRQVPLLDECLTRFECSRYADYDGGDHSLLLGFVEKVTVYDGEPLVFSKGQFLGLQKDGNGTSNADCTTTRQAV